MTLGLLFWIIVIVAVVFGGVTWSNPASPIARFGGWVPLILIVILGVAVFGFHLSR
jgi:hypothetical protein